MNKRPVFHAEDVAAMVSDARREGFQDGLDKAANVALDYLGTISGNYSNLQSMHKFRAIRDAIIKVANEINKLGGAHEAEKDPLR